MQNIDFYERKNIRIVPPQINTIDPEYYPRLAQNTPREAERIRKKATRAFFLISSLCIVSFTIGIIIGIKFSGGAQREIVDKKTFNAMTEIGNKFSNFIKERPTETGARENPFPKKSFPYVVKLRTEYDHAASQKIAAFLSHKGHTVILTKNNDNYSIYIGPYKNAGDAETALKKISAYQKYSLAENMRIIKR
ncbi:MAG: hypothetical protein A2W19_10940 [Spirochaetes bacterium RBG_16_49_21]|nr:MAG: hypothetical protein A2W19_10940 [Spirochaetes bacterium RBG_16_49_21]